MKLDDGFGDVRERNRIGLRNKAAIAISKKRLVSSKYAFQKQYLQHSKSVEMKLR